MAAFSTTSLLFNGTNGYVDVGDVAPLQFERTNPFSYSCWVKATASGTRMLVSKGVSPGISVYQASGKIYVDISNTYSSNNIEVYTTSVEIPTGYWKHVVVTYDGSSTAAGVKIYVDSLSRGLTVQFNNLTSTVLNASSFRIGSRTDGYYWQGYIDAVAVYNKELSAAEVYTLFGGAERWPVDHATVGPTANLVGYWRMGEGATFPTIPDDSANSNVGTMTNMVSGDIVADAPLGLITQDVVDLTALNGILLVPSTGFSKRDVVNFTPGGGAPPVTQYFKMRALADPGPGYLSWVATGAADFAGAGAGGAIQGGSAVVVAAWSV